MVLDVARVEVLVRAADEELRTRLVELEGEDALGCGVLRDGSVEEGVLCGSSELLGKVDCGEGWNAHVAKVGDLGKTETEQAVSGVRLELRRLLGDGGEVLSSDAHTTDGDCGGNTVSNHDKAFIECGAMLTLVGVGCARGSGLISVADREGAALLGALGRLAGVVRCVAAASRARRRGNPEVR